MPTITIDDDVAEGVRAGRINPLQGMQIMDARRAVKRVEPKLERLREQAKTLEEQIQGHEVALDELEPLLTADESQISDEAE